MLYNYCRTLTFNETSTTTTLYNMNDYGIHTHGIFILLKSVNAKINVLFDVLVVAH